MSSNSKNVVVNLELVHKATVKTQKTNEGFTHDWEVFVQGTAGGQVESFIEKVVFYLHTSFAKPKRVLKAPPYRVCEKGYGGFNLPIEIYFKTNEEPRKAKFEYDLYLQSLDSAPISNIRREKLTFIKPNEEFKRKLLQGGGTEVSNAEDSRMNEKSSKSRPSSGAKTKPVARHHAASSATPNNHSVSASDLPKKPKMETKKEVPKSKESDQFTALFGEIIKKGSSQKVKEKVSKEKEKSKTETAKKEKPKESKSPSTEKDPTKKDNKDKDKKKTEREDRDRERDKEKSRDKEKKTHEKKTKETFTEKEKTNKEKGEDKDKKKESKKEHAKRSISPAVAGEQQQQQQHQQQNPKKKKQEDREGKRGEGEVVGTKRGEGEVKGKKEKLSEERESKGREKERKEKHEKKEKKEKEKSKPPPPPPSPPPPVKEEKKKPPPPLQKPPTQATRGRPRKDAKRMPPSAPSPVPPPTHPLPSSKVKPKTKSSPTPPPPPPPPPPAAKERSRSKSSSRSRSPSLSISSSSSPQRSRSSSQSSRSSSQDGSPPRHSPTPHTSPSLSRSRSRSSSRSRSISRSHSRSSLSSSKSHSKSPSLKSVSRSESRSKSKSLSSSSSSGSSPSRGVGERGVKGTMNPLQILVQDISESSSDSEEKLLPVKAPQKGRSTPSSAPQNSPRPALKVAGGKNKPISPLSSDDTLSDEDKVRGREKRRTRWGSNNQHNQHNKDYITEPLANTNGTSSRGKGRDSDETPPHTVPNGTAAQTPSRSEFVPPKIDFSSDYLGELLELRNKIMKSFSDRAKVQEIVNIIGYNASYQLNQAHFTFDLCSLDKQTIRKLQHCLS